MIGIKYLEEWGRVHAERREEEIGKG